MKTINGIIDLSKESDRLKIFGEGEFYNSDTDSRIVGEIVYGGFYQGNYILTFMSNEKDGLKGSIHFNIYDSYRTITYTLNGRNFEISGKFTYPNRELSDSYKDMYLKDIYEYVLKAGGYSPQLN